MRKCALSCVGDGRSSVAPGVWSAYLNCGLCQPRPCVWRSLRCASPMPGICLRGPPLGVGGRWEPPARGAAEGSTEDSPKPMPPASSGVLWRWGLVSVQYPSPDFLVGVWLWHREYVSALGAPGQMFPLFSQWSPFFLTFSPSCWGPVRRQGFGSLGWRAVWG